MRKVKVRCVCGEVNSAECDYLPTFEQRHPVIIGIIAAPCLLIAAWIMLVGLWAIV